MDAEAAPKVSAFKAPTATRLVLIMVILIQSRYASPLEARGWLLLRHFNLGSVRL
jgi:hypothetical protein